MRRSDIATVAGAGLCAILIPIWLLWPRPLPTMQAVQVAVTRPKPAPDIAGLGERRLFAGGDDMASSALPQDAPELTGVVGRPPHDAVAMIRTAEGPTKALAPGESYAGWRLEAVSAEAALFSRGALQIRVPMPAADPRESSADQ